MAHFLMRESCLSPFPVFHFVSESCEKCCPVIKQLLTPLSQTTYYLGVGEGLPFKPVAFYTVCLFESHASF